MLIIKFLNIEINTQMKTKCLLIIDNVIDNFFFYESAF